MRKQFITGLLSLAAFAATAQSGPDKYAATITKEGLKKQLSVIASDEMEGRETGTEGQRKAAAYIAGQFESIGLKPAPGTDHYQQYYAIGYDSLLRSFLKIDDKDLVSGKDYADETANNNTGSLKADRIVFAGYGIGDPKYNDYEGKDVKGAVVVLFASEPKQDGNSLISGTRTPSPWGSFTIAKKAAFALEKGAKAIFIINVNIGDTLSAALSHSYMRTGVRVVKQADPGVSAITITQSLARQLLGDDF